MLTFKQFVTEEDITAGANSPFASPTVKQYKRQDYDSPVNRAQKTDRETVALKRAVYDEPPQKRSFRDQLNMMRMKQEVDYDRFAKEMDAKFKNKKYPVAEPPKAEPKKTVVGSTKDVKMPGAGTQGMGVQQSKPQIPQPKAKPFVTIGGSKGTNTIWDIAKQRVGKGGNVNAEVERIKKLNPTVKPERLQKGQRLNIEEKE